MWYGGLETHWSYLHYGVQLTIYQYWLTYWLGANQPTRHCLDQWWFILLEHVWVTRPKWIKNLNIISKLFDVSSVWTKDIDTPKNILTTFRETGPGPCITNVIATCRKNFSQWERSFLWKLRCHWLKFLRRVAKTLVIQGPALYRSFKLIYTYIYIYICNCKSVAGWFDEIAYEKRIQTCYITSA